MESNEKTCLISQTYNNYSCKSHHLHYKSTISRVVGIRFYYLVPTSKLSNIYYKTSIYDQLIRTYPYIGPFKYISYVIYSRR